MGGLRLTGLRGTSMFDMNCLHVYMNSWVEVWLEVVGFMPDVGSSMGGLG